MEVSILWVRASDDIVQLLENSDDLNTSFSCKFNLKSNFTEFLLLSHICDHFLHENCVLAASNQKTIRRIYFSTINIIIAVTLRNTLFLHSKVNWISILLIVELYFLKHIIIYSLSHAIVICNIAINNTITLYFLNYHLIDTTKETCVDFALPLKFKTNHRYPHILSGSAHEHIYHNFCYVKQLSNRERYFQPENLWGFIACQTHRWGDHLLTVHEQRYILYIFIQFYYMTKCLTQKLNSNEIFWLFCIV